MYLPLAEKWEVIMYWFRSKLDGNAKHIGTYRSVTIQGSQQQKATLPDATTRLGGRL